MEGWAQCSVATAKKAGGIRGAVATPNPTNTEHADLLKAEWLVIKAEDKGRDKREKAHMLAHAMSDLINTSLEKGEANIVRVLDIGPKIEQLG